MKSILRGQTRCLACLRPHIFPSVRPIHHYATRTYVSNSTIIAFNKNVKPFSYKMDQNASGASSEMDKLVHKIERLLARYSDLNNHDILDKASRSIRKGIINICLDAQSHHGRNILVYIGGILQRWDMVSTISRLLTSMRVKPAQLMSDGVFPMFGNQVNYPLRKVMDEEVSDAIRSHTLSSIPREPLFTSRAAHIDYEAPYSHRTVQESGAGLLLQALGEFVLKAESLQDVQQSQFIMDLTLNLLGMLHHHDMLPDLTYWYEPTSDPKCLNKIPAFAFLSQYMLTAILDAEYNIHNNITDDESRYQSIAQFPIKGFEFPSTNNPKKIIPYAHNLWFEFILWICLEGKWAFEGLKLLETMITIDSEIPWRAKPWSEYLIKHNKHDNYIFSERTISAEIVRAYMEAMIDSADLQVGPKRIPRQLLSTLYGKLESLNHANLNISSNSQIKRYELSLFYPTKKEKSIVMNPVSEHLIKDCKSSDMQVLLNLSVSKLSFAADYGSSQDILNLLNSINKIRHGRTTPNTTSLLSVIQSPRITSLIHRFSIDKIKLPDELEKELIHDHDIKIDINAAPCLIEYAVTFMDMALLEELLNRWITSQERPRLDVVLALCLSQIRCGLFTPLSVSIDALTVRYPVEKWHGSVLAAMGSYLISMNPGSANEMELNVFEWLLDMVKDKDLARSSSIIQQETQLILDLVGTADENLKAWCERHSTLSVDGSIPLPSRALDYFKCILQALAGCNDQSRLVKFWRLWNRFLDPEDVQSWRWIESPQTYHSVHGHKRSSRNSLHSIPKSNGRNVYKDAAEIGTRRYFPTLQIDQEASRILLNGLGKT